MNVLEQLAVPEWRDTSGSDTRSCCTPVTMQMVVTPVGLRASGVAIAGGKNKGSKLDTNSLNFN